MHLDNTQLDMANSITVVAKFIDTAKKKTVKNSLKTAIMIKNEFPLSF